MRKDNVDETALVTLEQVRNDLEVIAFVQQANEALRGLGYTEHGQRHAGLVAHVTVHSPAPRPPLGGINGDSPRIGGRGGERLPSRLQR